jgi:hypothetical protein
VTDPQSWADFHNMPFIKADASDALKDWAGKTSPALEPHLEMVGAALPGPRVERWHRWKPQAKFKDAPSWRNLLLVGSLWAGPKQWRPTWALVEVCCFGS